VVRRINPGKLAANGDRFMGDSHCLIAPAHVGKRCREIVQGRCEIRKVALRVGLGELAAKSDCLLDRGHGLLAPSRLAQ
jgi:hypothetical protein